MFAPHADHDDLSAPSLKRMRHPTTSRPYWIAGEDSTIVDMTKGIISWRRIDFGGDGMHTATPEHELTWLLVLSANTRQTQQLKIMLRTKRAKLTGFTVERASLRRPLRVWQAFRPDRRAT